MSETDATARRYDAMPYESHAFHESHPDHLAALATLHGMSPPDVSTCRVLELGCAGGGNLIPMALALPGASFVGVDLSPRQIGDGRATIAALGLGNIELRIGDIAALTDDIGPFDYVIAHGVYSWVPEHVRERLMTLTRAVLAPRGVAFISYNTLPGWHLLGIVRDLLLFHVEELDDPAAQVRAAREILGTVVEAMPDKTTPYALAVRREVDQLKARSDSYLLHEFLEPASRPLHVREFAGRAAAQGLRALADARFRMSAGSQPDDLRQALDGLSDDPVRREQYLDFIRNRAFRRTLLVHESAGAGRSPDPARLEKLRVAAAAAPTSPFPDLHTAAPEVFRTFDGTQQLTAPDPLVKATLTTVAEAWPSSLAVPELRRRTLARLDEPSRRAGPPEPFDRSPEAARLALLRALGSGLIDLRTIDPPFARFPGAQPTASPYARRQAESGRLVTNLLHRVVELSEFDRLVLRQLDGTRDRSAIIDALTAAALTGAFPLNRDGQPITDAIEARQIMERSVDPALTRLLGSTLLVDPAAPGSTVHPDEA